MVGSTNKETFDPFFLIEEITSERSISISDFFQPLFEVTTSEEAAKGLVRARNSKGHYVSDDPSTPENEAWVNDTK